MNAERRQRIEELFEQLADAPRSEQRRLLEAACGGDGGLVEEVEALLQADAQEHPILRQHAASLASALLDGGGGAVVPGRFGRYAIQQYLGEGGMGAVYLARRDGLDDLVAVKFLHDPWSSPSRRRRFAIEQRTLAGLNHRFIARLYDAGVTNGTPWFAMEYVPGVSIVEHCRRQASPLHERLRLFRAACEAVSWAHRNLVVHLDIKPSNILVKADGEVKLVDFGIARQLTHEGGDAEKTTTGQRLLSLTYASPEQIRGDAVDVQTDVHALGIVLYELLAGRPPADLKTVSAAEIAAFLQEEPQRPSAAAREGHAGAILASSAQWKDLDALCLTAVRRARTERYQTVDAMIRDLDHFLRHEPLEAHTGRLAWYRTRKFVTRHRRPVAAAAAVTAIIAALTAFFTLGLVDARDSAVASEARMQRIHRLMLNLFEGDDTAAGPAGGLRVVSLLDRGVREAESLVREPDLQAELRYTLGSLYYKLGHLDRAEPLLLSAWTARTSLYGRDHPEAMRAQLTLALLRVAQARTDEAEQLARSSLETANRLYAPDSLEVATATAVLGKVVATRGDYHAAIPLLEQAEAQLSKGPGTAELSEALGDLANTHYHVGHIDVAEAVNRRGLVLDREVFGERHPNVAVDLYNLAVIQLDRGDYRQSERMLREALEINEAWYGPVHPNTASALLMLGRSIAYQGRPDEASALYQRALISMRTVYGESHFRFASVLSLMGDLARERGDVAEAQRLFQQAAAIFKDVLGEQHEFYLHQLSNLASVWVARDRHAEAEALLRTAVEGLIAVVPDQLYTGLAQTRLGAALAGQRRYEEAEAYARAGYVTLQKVLGASTAEMQSARRGLVTIYLTLGQPARASELEAELRQAELPGPSRTSDADP